MSGFCPTIELAGYGPVSIGVYQSLRDGDYEVAGSLMQEHMAEFGDRHPTTLFTAKLLTATVGVGFAAQVFGSMIFAQSQVSAPLSFASLARPPEDTIHSSLSESSGKVTAFLTATALGGYRLLSGSKGAEDSSPVRLSNHSQGRARLELLKRADMDYRLQHGDATTVDCDPESLNAYVPTLDSPDFVEGESPYWVNSYKYTVSEGYDPTGETRPEDPSALIGDALAPILDEMQMPDEREGCGSVTSALACVEGLTSLNGTSSNSVQADFEFALKAVAGFGEEEDIVVNPAELPLLKADAERAGIDVDSLDLRPNSGGYSLRAAPIASSVQFNIENLYAPDSPEGT